MNVNLLIYKTSVPSSKRKKTSVS